MTDTPWKRKEVIGDCTLYFADCMDVMTHIGRAAAVVTDPPYGIGESGKKNRSRVGLAQPTDYGNFSWDSKPASPEQLSALIAASDYQIIWGGNYFKSLPFPSRWLVWDKENSGDFADGEMAWTNLDGALRIFRWQWNGFIRKGEMDKVKSPVFKQHPTQKPVALMEWCISFIKHSGAILDPFMGSGTTGVACVKAGRPFIGIELDEGYFDVACERIRKAYLQPDFFVDAAREPTPKQEALL